jgi:hypothetical protein
VRDPAAGRHSNHNHHDIQPLHGVLEGGPAHVELRAARGQQPGHLHQQQHQQWSTSTRWANSQPHPQHQARQVQQQLPMLTDEPSSDAIDIMMVVGGDNGGSNSGAGAGGGGGGGGGGGYPLLSHGQGGPPSTSTSSTFAHDSRNEGMNRPISRGMMLPPRKSMGSRNAHNESSVQEEQRPVTRDRRSDRRMEAGPYCLLIVNPKP